MIYRILFALCLTALIFINPVLAQSPIRPKTAKTPPRTRVVTESSKVAIQEKINQLAPLYGVQPIIALAIVQAESQYNRYAVGDSGYSRGLVQIHSKYHPNITDEQAFDVDFSLKFLMENLAKGNCWMWSTYPMKTCPEPSG
jgi:soluble lytic murein transglycosylase-like protein